MPQDLSRINARLATEYFWTGIYAAPDSVFMGDASDWMAAWICWDGL